MVDTLVGNAAKATGVYEQTEDGWETTLQVNYLSNALLCILLLPHLIKHSSSESPCRIILVSSDGHFFIDGSKLPKDSDILVKLNDFAYCSSSTVMKDRYNVSKVLLMMFARELAARLPAHTPVAVMNVNPGFCHSRLTREAESRIPKKWFVRLFKSMVARTTEVGSRTIAHAVVTSEERKFHGRYVSVCELSEESEYVLSAEGMDFANRLWKETIEVLNKADPRVGEIVQSHLSSCISI